MHRPKYIYFAGDNLLGTPYYRKAFIVGETFDLVHRQYMYAPGKGMHLPDTGDLVSYRGERGLLWPFLDYFEVPAGVSDRDIHRRLSTRRPFTDFVSPIRDRTNMYTREAFCLYGGRLEDRVDQIKRLILDWLAD